MIILASVIVFARLSIQIWKRKTMETQDFLIYFAFVCFLTMSICYLIIVPKIYRIGRVRLGIIKPWPTMANDVIEYIRMMFVTTTLFWIALWSVKLSLLALYKKLMEGLPKIYLRLWWVLFIFCIISLAGCIISYFTACSDFAGSLSRGVCSGPRSVRGQLASLYTSYAVDVLSDFMIMALPIKLVWNLQMACGQKVAVIALFASGFVCIAFATIRVIQVGVKAGNGVSPSPTWLALWTIIESAIAICIGCCPAFAVLYRTSRTTQASYDTNGYIRQDQSRSGAGYSRRDTIAMKPVTTGFSRSRISKSGVYWDDTTSSQEELAADSKGIKVTTTLQQDSSHSSEAHFTDAKEELRGSIAIVSPTSPSRTFLADRQ